MVTLRTVYINAVQPIIQQIYIICPNQSEHRETCTGVHAFHSFPVLSLYTAISNKI